MTDLQLYPITVGAVTFIDILGFLTCHQRLDFICSLRIISSLSTTSNIILHNPYPLFHTKIQNTRMS